MRRIPLRANDFLLFANDFVSHDYEFFSRHASTFKRMWRDQGKDFWKQFVRCFREYSVYNGVFKDFPPKTIAKKINVKEFIDGAISYLEEEFVKGKESNAKNLITNCAFVAANKGNTHNYGAGFAKDPFYVKETRDVFRTMFGDPNDGMTYMRGYFYLPLFVKFAGAAMKVLRVWLEAPEVWDVPAYMADLEKQLSDSIAENKQRKIEETAMKAQERRDKKRASKTKDEAKKEAKYEAFSSSTADGEAASKSKLKKKKKKKQKSDPTAAAPAAAADIDGCDDGMEKQKEAATQDVVKEQQASGKVEAKPPGFSSVHSGNGDLDMPSVMEGEHEVIAPTARLFKDWRPPSAEPFDTGESDSWAKVDVEGRPQFPFLGFHHDPDELSAKSSDVSTDSMSPLGSRDLPGSDLSAVVVNAYDVSDASYSKVSEQRESTDRQEAQEKESESESIMELMHLLAKGLMYDDAMIDTEFDEMARNGQGAGESGTVSHSEDTDKQNLHSENVETKKGVIDESRDVKQSDFSIIPSPSATVHTSTSLEETDVSVDDKDITQQSTLVSGTIPEVSDLKLDFDVQDLNTSQTTADTDKPETKNDGGINSAGKDDDNSKDNDDDDDVHECEVKNIHHGTLTADEFADKFLSSAGDMETGNDDFQYQGSFITPEGGRVHVARQTIGNETRYNFVELPAMLDKYDEMLRENSQSTSDGSRKGGMSRMALLATELMKMEYPDMEEDVLQSSDSGEPSVKRYSKTLSAHDFELASQRSLTTDKESRNITSDAERRPIVGEKVKKPGDILDSKLSMAGAEGGTVSTIAEDTLKTDHLVTVDDLMQASSSNPSAFSLASTDGQLTVSGRKNASSYDFKAEDIIAANRKIDIFAKDQATQTYNEQEQDSVTAHSQLPAVKDEFSGGPGWINAFCKGEPISTFDRGLCQSVFARKVNSTTLQGPAVGSLKNERPAKKTKQPIVKREAVKTQPMPEIKGMSSKKESASKQEIAEKPTEVKREFPALTEMSMSDVPMRELMTTATGGIFFVTRLGTYSLLKNPKWASFYASYICSHSCHADPEAWKKHSKVWKDADKREAASKQPSEITTTKYTYYDSVFTTHDSVNIPLLYCYLGWNLQPLSSLKLPGDADKICALRIVFISPRGNDHVVDFLTKFLEVSEPGAIETYVFPTFEMAQKRNGFIKRVTVDPVERPSVVSAFTVVDSNGNKTFLANLQEKFADKTILASWLVGEPEPAQTSMEEEGLSKRLTQIGTAEGMQALSAYVNATVKDKQDPVFAGSTLPSSVDQDPSSIHQSKAAHASVAKPETKSSAKQKRKGKRRQEKRDMPDVLLLRTCNNCGKEETAPKTFKKCKLCLDRPDARYYCSRECQAEDWKTKHRLDHSSKK